MSKIHVLPDENLGGVLREYVEVDREANVGDKIVIVNPHECQFGDSYTKGTIMSVEKANEDGDVYCGKFDIIEQSEYQTLEPTDIVHIDGKRYRMVDRKANVGEKIIAIHYDIVSDLIVKPGDVLTVKRVDSDGVECVGDAYFSSDYFNDEYRVLEPLPETIETSKSAIDLLANLAQRVTKLERENKELRHQSHNHRLDIEQIYIDVKSLRENVDVLDERTQPLVALTEVVFKHFASVALEHLNAVKENG